MKKHSSVQGKLGFSCDALLNAQVLLSLTRQAVSAAGANAPHWHSINVVVLELAGGGSSSSPWWTEEDEELAKAGLLARVQGACPREPVSLEGGNQCTRERVQLMLVRYHRPAKWGCRLGRVMIRSDIGSHCSLFGFVHYFKVLPDVFETQPACCLFSTVVKSMLFAAVERNNLMRLAQTIPFTPVQLFGEYQFPAYVFCFINSQCIIFLKAVFEKFPWINFSNASFLKEKNQDRIVVMQ